MNEHKLPVLNLKQLHYFVVLADHGSISSAAAALGIAQPSLSETIAKLERSLEVTLVVRGCRGVQLTEAGVMLSRFGREMRQEADTIVEGLRQLSDFPRGLVSVGLTPSLGVLLTVPLVETVQIEYPQVRLHIAEGMTGNLLEWMQNGRLDMAFVYDVVESNELSFKPVLEETLYLVTATDNWAAPIAPDGLALEHVDAIDLAGLPLVLPSSSHASRRIIEGATKAHGIQLNIISEIDSLSQIVEMVSRASAYTILPQTAVAPEVANGSLALIPIANPTITRTIQIARRRSRPVTSASAAVEATISGLFSEMIRRHKLQASLRVLAARKPDSSLPAREAKPAPDHLAF